MLPSVENLQRLIEIPHGCGEQNMVGFAPDVFIAKYLRNIGKYHSDVSLEIQRNLEIGKMLFVFLILKTFFPKLSEIFC